MLFEAIRRAAIYQERGPVLLAELHRKYWLFRSNRLASQAQFSVLSLWIHWHALILLELLRAIGVVLLSHF